MSIEMVKKKKEELEELEKAEAAELAKIRMDECPACKFLTSEQKFFNVNVLKMFGWVECSNCGCVYSPKSILKQKEIMAASGIVPTVQENPSIIQVTS